MPLHQTPEGSLDLHETEEDDLHRHLQALAAATMGVVLKAFDLDVGSIQVGDLLFLCEAEPSRGVYYTSCLPTSGGEPLSAGLTLFSTRGQVGKFCKINGSAQPHCTVE